MAQGDFYSPRAILHKCGVGGLSQTLENLASLPFCSGCSEADSGLFENLTTRATIVVGASVNNSKHIELCRDDYGTASEAAFDGVLSTTPLVYDVNVK